LKLFIEDLQKTDPMCPKEREAVKKYAREKWAEVHLPMEVLCRWCHQTWHAEALRKRRKHQQFSGEDDVKVAVIGSFFGCRWTEALSLFDGHTARSLRYPWNDTVKWQWRGKEEQLLAMVEYGDVESQLGLQTRRFRWTAEEDEELLAAAKQSGLPDVDWNAVAELIPDRTAEQCQRRFAKRYLPLLGN
jgi:hypothetical protein